MSANESGVLIYCDGACSGNPGPGGWGAIVAPTWPKGVVAEMGGAASGTTNNRMELTAIIEALKAVVKIKSPVFVHTDSTYVIRGITQWIFKWQKNGFKKADGEEVTNQDLWSELSSLVQQRGGGIEWIYVPGHAGIDGNERTDQIAVSFSQGRAPNLYRGPIDQYSVTLERRAAVALPEMKRPDSNNGGSPGGIKPFYLSYVNGVLERHDTWAECEARVKGRPGTKFKKISSLSEEEECLKKWGIR